MPVHGVGQPGVGLGDDRQARAAAKLRQQRCEQVGPQRAVETDGVRAQPLQRARHGGDGAAGEGAAARFKRHRDEHGQRGALLHGEQRGLRLVQVGHRFDHGEIGARRRARLGDLAEEIIGVLKRETAHRFEQLAERPDVERDERIGSGGFARDAHGGADDLVHAVTGARELFAVRAEGVRVDHLTARVDVGAVHGANEVGLRQIQQLRLAAGRQAALLQDGAHAAVEHQDLVLKISQLHSLFLPCAARRFAAARNRRSRGYAPFAAHWPDRSRR